jgi:phosphopantetheinyl transferase
MNRAIVLHASLPAAARRPSWDESLLHALPYARRLQLERYGAAQRCAGLAGIALALFGAERIAGRPFAPRDFSFPPGRKPFLTGGPEFSISHTALRVACCVTQAPGCGLDIEDVPQQADAAAITRLRRWTATESVLKAAGAGLRAVRDVELDAECTAGVLRNERLRLQPLAGIPGCLGHIASHAGLTWSLVAVDLDGAAISAALERSLGLAAQLE